MGEQPDRPGEFATSRDRHGHGQATPAVHGTERAHPQTDEVGWGVSQRIKMYHKQMR